MEKNKFHILPLILLCMIVIIFTIVFSSCLIGIDSKRDNKIPSENSIKEILLKIQETYSLEFTNILKKYEYKENFSDIINNSEIIESLSILFENNKTDWIEKVLNSNYEIPDLILITNNLEEKINKLEEYYNPVYFPKSMNLYCREDLLGGDWEAFWETFWEKYLNFLLADNIDYPINDIALIDRINILNKSLEIGLIPEEIDYVFKKVITDKNYIQYFNDDSEVFLSLWIDKNFNKFIEYNTNNLMPEICEEIDVIFNGDKIISNDESKQINFLNSLTKEEQQVVLNNNLIANMDFDGDKMSNYFEKNIADLPYNIKNDRYVISINTLTASINNPNFIIDSALKKLYSYLGIPEENIWILFNQSAEEYATYDNSKNVIEQLRKVSDENDIIYISIMSHGSPGSETPPPYATLEFADDNGYEHGGDSVTCYEIGELLNTLKFNRMLIIMHSCAERTPIYSFNSLKGSVVIFPVFTDHILFEELYGNNLEEMDENKDTYISIEEIYKFLLSGKEYMSDWFEDIKIRDLENIADKMFFIN